MNERAFPPHSAAAEEVAARRGKLNIAKLGLHGDFLLILGVLQYVRPPPSTQREETESIEGSQVLGHLSLSFSLAPVLLPELIHSPRGRLPTQNQCNHEHTPSAQGLEGQCWEKISPVCVCMSGKCQSVTNWHRPPKTVFSFAITRHSTQTALPRSPLGSYLRLPTINSHEQGSSSDYTDEVTGGE